MWIVLTTFFVIIPTMVESHGYMTWPYIRGGIGAQLGTDTAPAKFMTHPNEMTSADLNKITCHNRKNGPTSNSQGDATYNHEGNVVPVHYDNTIKIGEKFTIEARAFASHPGDCAWYISYDLDLPDLQKKWHLFYKKRDCMCTEPQVADKSFLENHGGNFIDMCYYVADVKTVTSYSDYKCGFSPSPAQVAPNSGYHTTDVFKFPDAVIPSHFPSAEHAILRYEWYAIHRRDTENIVEIYANCADVKLTGGTALPNGKELSYIRIGDENHIPLNSAQQYDSNCKGNARIMHFPALAEEIAIESDSATTSSPVPPPSPPPTVSKYCQGVECGPHGTCNEVSKKCDCRDGYIGSMCQTRPCLAPNSPTCDPLHSNGCVDSSGSATCQPCRQGYSGQNCDTPPADTCDDGILNQDEITIDCGGSNCVPCPAEYNWIVEPWEKCTEECGNGTQSRKVKCVDSTGKTATDIKNCASSYHEFPTIQYCNTQECATYSWSAPNWNNIQCNQLCGNGTKTREVNCVSSIGNVIVKETYCSTTPKMSEIQDCFEDACCTGLGCIEHEYKWIGRWSNCTGMCGTQDWIWECIWTIDNSLSNDRSCVDPKPASRDPQDCMLIGCQQYSWHVCSWDACTASCGGHTGMLGSQYRDVYCKDSSGTIVDPIQCPGEKPVSFDANSCNSQACIGPNWMADGDWSVCTKFGQQIKTYHCHDINGGNADDESLCASAPRPSGISADDWTAPVARRNCDLGFCPKIIAFNHSTKLHSIVIKPIFVFLASFFYFL